MPDIRDEIVKEGGVRPLISAMNNYPQERLLEKRRSFVMIIGETSWNIDF